MPLASPSLSSAIRQYYGGFRCPGVSTERSRSRFLWGGRFDLQKRFDILVKNCSKNARL